MLTYGIQSAVARMRKTLLQKKQEGTPVQKEPPTSAAQKPPLTEAMPLEPARVSPPLPAVAPPQKKVTFPPMSSPPTDLLSQGWVPRPAVYTYVTQEVPDVTCDDIGGLDEQIEVIYDAIEFPYLHWEEFVWYQLAHLKGFLLYGPPGCGKTMVVKAVANSLCQTIRNHLTNLEQDIEFYQDLRQTPADPGLVVRYKRLFPTGNGLTPDTTALQPDIVMEELIHFLGLHNIKSGKVDEKLAELRAVLARKDGVCSFFLKVDMYAGKTEQLIQKIFEEARSRATFYTPVIIFFDDMEAIFPARGLGRPSDVEATLISQFLSEIDGIESTSNLIIIGACNRQDMIDPAIFRPGRLDVRIKIERPTRQSAQDIFSKYLLPTLPLSAEGIIYPSLADPGEIVFRTAYQRTVDPRQIEDLRELLPEGCDFRLAFSLQPSDLNRISSQSRATVGEIIAHESEESPLKIKLRRFKANLEVWKIVKSLQEVQKRYTIDNLAKQAIDAFIRQEWLAEILILRATNLLYSSTSTISVLTERGTSYTFPLKDFMSGALIANIVDRAKRIAAKLTLIRQQDERGISWQDLFEAIVREFDENKEQFAVNRLHTELGSTEEKFVSFDLNLSGS